MKNFEFKLLSDNENYEPDNLCINVPFTQFSFYGEWQRLLGRKVKRFLVTRDGEEVAYFQMIKYPLLFGKSYFYIPYGPVTKDSSEVFLKSLKEEIKKISKTENIVFVRLDFTPVISNDSLSKVFIKSPLYTYHSAYFQPRFEWFLNLNKPEDDLLMGMHEKTRYAIRFAEKKDIKIEIVIKDFENHFDSFYELMNITAKRNGFGLHNKDYYLNLFKNLSKTKAYLSIAKYNDKVLAMDLIIVSGKIANYVFGGSSNEERKLMPTYLAQWKSICYAKDIGCEYYNFGGISGGDNLYKGWEGLTFYKKKFGGEEVKHSNFFDIVINPFWYHLYNFRKFIKKIIS